MEKYDNIIIGGGIAGLICAGYLAKAGQKTILFEARGHGGGRIVSPIDEFDGYKVHIHGVTHHPTMGDGGFWHAAAKDLGAKVRLRLAPPGAIVWLRGKGYAYRFRRAYSDVEGMLELAAVQSPEPFTDASKKDLKKMLEEILNWDFMRMCADLDAVFLHDWLNERTKNPQVHHFFFNLFCQMVNFDMVDTINHAGAGKFFTLFRQWLAREGNFGICTDGTIYENLIKPFEEVFVSLGGELKCKAAVDKVVVEGDRAKGVILAGPEGREYRAKRIIVSAPYPYIARLFENLPPEVASSIRDLEKTWTIDIATYSGLGRKVTDEPRFVAAQDPADWSYLLGLMAFSLAAPWSAPPGKHLIWTERIYRKEDYDKTKIKDYYEEIDQITEEVWPGFRESVEVQKHTVHPLLWHHQYSGYKKIPQKAESISDLYFIGDGTTPQYGQGSDGAASTGVILAKQLLNIGG